MKKIGLIFIILNLLVTNVSAAEIEGAFGYKFGEVYNTDDAIEVEKSDEGVIIAVVPLLNLLSF